MAQMRAADGADAQITLQGLLDSCIRIAGLGHLRICGSLLRHLRLRSVRICALL
jgi:hypothetical protein